MDSSTQLKTTTVTGQRIDPKRMRFETASGSAFVVGEDGSPGEYMLGSLAACYNLVGHVVATEMGIEIADLRVSVAGDVDPRTYNGEANESRAGYREIRVTIDVDTDADADTLDEWIRAVEDRCPVCDNVAAETPTKASVEPV